MRSRLSGILTLVLTSGAMIFVTIIPAQQRGIDVSGKWRSNVGREYLIEQSGNRFSWREVSTGEEAEGTIEGDRPRAFWPKSSRTMSAEGRIVIGDRPGQAVRIEWSNGVVFIREPEPGPSEPERERRQPGQREGPPPPERVQIGGTWYGNNKLVYDFIQRGNRFEWHASDGSRGDGFFTEDMEIRTGFPIGGVVPGRIVIGNPVNPPGRAVMIEWQNGLVMTRGEPPRGEERAPGETERLKRERLEGPPITDLRGRWHGNNGLEYEVEQAGIEFSWRVGRTGETAHGRLEEGQLRVIITGREMESVQGQTLKADGLQATIIRWANGVVFTREPSRAELRIADIERRRNEETVVHAYALKKKTYNVWIKTGGPVGGLGYDVRYRENTAAGINTIYVTDNYTGVNISTDGGKTWAASNKDITARSGNSMDAIPVFSLTVDPNKPDIVWCGLKDLSGAYKSTNGGKDWTNVSPRDLGQFVFRGFTIQQGNSDVVFAAGEVPEEWGRNFSKAKGRVYRTKDGGKTWTKVWEDENLMRYILINPHNPKIIYVSTGIFDREANNSDCKNSDCGADPNKSSARGGVGILKSTDGGNTWSVLGRRNGLTDLYVGSLVMDPSNPDILLAGCGNVSTSYYKSNGQTYLLGGVFRTTDGGKTWLRTLDSEMITSVEFGPKGSQIAYAGGNNNFYRSGDGGQTWNTVNGDQTRQWGPPGVIAGIPIDILVDPKNKDVLFVNNYGGGVVKSTNGGKTWTVASTGYTGAEMYDVDIDVNNPYTVFAAARSGAFRSANGGDSWEGLSYPPASFYGCFSVAVNPDNPKIVIAAVESSGNVYRSTDGGSTWVEAPNPDLLKGVDPGDPNKWFGLKRIVFAPSNRQIVYAGSCRSKAGNGDPGLGVYKSTNGGVKWDSANTTQTQKLGINNLAVHPSNPDIVYVATWNSGLWKTTDGGASWTKLQGLNATDVRCVAVRPDKVGVVYAGLNSGGVWVSTDGGSNWSQMASGMEANDPIFALVVDPANPDIVWAGSNQTGVYVYSHDQIEQQWRWVHFNTGLTTRAVTDLSISKDGKVLYATTWGEGVFRLELPPAGTK